MVCSVLIETHPSKPMTDNLIHNFTGFTNILRLLCLRFTPNDSLFTKIKNNLFLLFLLTISSYVVLFDIFVTIRNMNVQHSTVGIVMIIWSAQSVVNILFLAKWQKSQTFQKFFNDYREAELEETVYEKQRRLSLSRNSICFYCLNLLMFLLMANSVYSMIMGWDKDMLPVEIQYTFYYPQLRYFRIYQVINFTLWNLCIHVYISLTNYIYWEVKTYNWKVRKLSPSNIEELESMLVSLVSEHTKLSRVVRSLDKLFTAYAFIMISTIIPTFLFTLIMLITRNSTYELILYTPSAAFCVYGYYGLTAAPAKLHAELFSSKAALCSNEQIWVPYSQHTNQLAQTLSIHMDQTDLGITIWGFALVSKPLILTTFSAMMTFLALLLEFKPEKT